MMLQNTDLGVIHLFQILAVLVVKQASTRTLRAAGASTDVTPAPPLTTCVRWVSGSTPSIMCAIGQLMWTVISNSGFKV